VVPEDNFAAFTAAVMFVPATYTMQMQQAFLEVYIDMVSPRSRFERSRHLPGNNTWREE